VFVLIEPFSKVRNSEYKNARKCGTGRLGPENIIKYINAQLHIEIYDPELGTTLRIWLFIPEVL
jgi:hypothetical protein